MQRQLPAKVSRAQVAIGYDPSAEPGSLGLRLHPTSFLHGIFVSRPDLNMHRRSHRQIRNIKLVFGGPVVTLNRCRVAEEPLDAARRQPWVVDGLQVPKVVVGINQLLIGECTHGGTDLTSNAVMIAKIMEAKQPETPGLNELTMPRTHAYCAHYCIRSTWDHKLCIDPAFLDHHTMSRHLQHKRLAHQGLAKALQAPATQMPEILADIYHADAHWSASHPINDLREVSAIVDTLRTLRESFPDIQRRDDIVVGGPDGATDYVGIMGHYQATFMNDWLGIPASSGVVHIRYGELHRFEDGKIARSYVLIDLLDLMRQAGTWPIAPSLGTEGRWPGPETQDGLRLADNAVDEGRNSVNIMQKMHQGLLDFDGLSIASMNYAQYLAEHFMWYGPSGIGTTRGLRGFQTHHQIPFLTAFPDRDLGGEYICFGDGPFAATGGWPAMGATHTGPNWLGLAPTQKRITLRVMDFYRVQDGLIYENWVPIDILHILEQLGVDVFSRLRPALDNSKPTLRAPQTNR